MISRFCIALLLFFAAASAHAQGVGADATGDARSHFRQGLAHAQQGDLLAALHEFEAAYAIQPHFSVLYNIARAHTTLGHPVQAALAFERYLADGGQQVAPARREEVVTLLAAARARVGKLLISVTSGSTTRVWLDGTEVPGQNLNVPFSVAVGEHTLILADGVGFPESRTVAVTATDLAEVRVATRAAPTQKRDALLSVLCDVPDVHVEVAGVKRGKPPVTPPLLVPEGSLSVAFSRPGYRSVTRTVTTQAGKISTVGCDGLSPLPSSLSARLVVDATPADVELDVDGQPFTGAALSPGLHVLRIARDGFVAQQRLISLEAGKVLQYQATLVPTPANRERQRAAEKKQRTLGLVLASFGIAAAGTGVGVYAWNSGRYDDWRATAGAGSDYRTATSIQRLDDASVGLMVVGGALTLTGSWLFFDAH